MNLLKKTLWIVFFNGLLFLGNVFPGVNDFIQQENSIRILDTRVRVEQLFLYKFLSTTKAVIVHKLQEVVSSGDYDELKDELFVDLRACLEAINLVEEIVDGFNMGCMAYNPEPKIRFVNMCNVLRGIECIGPHNVRKQLKFVEKFNKYITSYFMSRRDFFENKDSRLLDKLINLNQKLINNILKNDYLDIDFVDKAIDWFIHRPWELFYKYKFVPITAGVTLTAVAAGVPLWLLSKGGGNERLSEGDGESILNKQDDLGEIFCGIQNLGNTCFINSLTQCLFHCPVFLNSLSGVDIERRCLDRHLVAFVRSMSKYKRIKPTAYVGYIWSLFDRGRRGRQNCAAECFNLMLPVLLNENVKNIFQCALESRITCNTCNEISGLEEPGSYISCSIPTRKENNNNIRIQDCLDGFFVDEILQVPNAYNCRQCGGLVERATKKYELRKNPAILVIHLKRFNNSGTKIYRPTLVNDGLKLKGKDYRLKSVVLHKGDLGGGHYTALAREAFRVDGLWQSGNRWIYCDDSNVRFDAQENGLREKLRTNGYISVWWRSYTPYLLFYERVDE